LEDGPLGVRQRQTLHYRHLREPEGGLIHVASSVDQHLAHLGRFLRDAEAGTPNLRSRLFVAAFVRPRGLERPVAPLLAAEIAELASAPTRVEAPGRIGRAVGSALARVAFALGLPLRERPVRTAAVQLVATGVIVGARAAGAFLDWRRKTTPRLRDSLARAPLARVFRKRVGGRRLGRAVRVAAVRRFPRNKERV
jgi:hypothetical protein